MHIACQIKTAWTQFKHISLITQMNWETGKTNVNLSQCKPSPNVGPLKEIKDCNKWPIIFSKQEN